MIMVSPDPDGQAVERCCFCRNRTKFWFLPKDVACCLRCAKHANIRDVPSKKTWMRRELIVREGIMECKK